LEQIVILFLHCVLLLDAGNRTNILNHRPLLFYVILQFLLGTLLVIQQQKGLGQQTYGATVVQFKVGTGSSCQSFALQAHQHLSIQETLRKLLMTEILVVALSNFQYFFVKFVNGGLVLEAVLLVRLFPVLELMISAAVEGSMALTALKEGLFLAYLASLGLWTADELLGHRRFELLYFLSSANKRGKYHKLQLILTYLIYKLKLSMHTTY